LPQSLADKHIGQFAHRTRVSDEELISKALNYPKVVFYDCAITAAKTLAVQKTASNVERSLKAGIHRRKPKTCSW
jgi:hypothetical protein